MNFTLKSLQHCLNLNFFKKMLHEPTPSPTIDFSYHSEECSKEIKEFLNYTQTTSAYTSKVYKPRKSAIKKGTFFETGSSLDISTSRFQFPIRYWCSLR